MTPAEPIKDRLRADLRRALKARENVAVAVLRGLIADIDNAESIPVGDAHQKYASRPFGKPGVEAPRRALTPEAIDQIFRREIQTLEATALARERRGDDVWAAGFRERAALIVPYLKQV